MYLHLFIYLYFLYLYDIFVVMLLNYIDFTYYDHYYSTFPIHFQIYTRVICIIVLFFNILQLQYIKNQ